MTYDPRADGLACYELALRWLAMRAGSRRATRPAEMYWIEQHGGIP